MLILQKISLFFFGWQGSTVACDFYVGEVVGDFGNVKLEHEVAT